jgi:hypothetical protein
MNVDLHLITFMSTLLYSWYTSIFIVVLRFLTFYLRLICVIFTGRNWLALILPLVKAEFFLICDLHNAESAGHGEEAKGNEDLDVHV